jgi:anti-repressor protein
MNEMKVFNNERFGEVRIISINGEPWFVGKDVAEILGYSDTFGALKKHVDDDDKQNCQNSSFESNRGLTVINESGLYSLILSSKLPAAKEFKKWVTAEILPSIRKYGAYMMEQTVEKALTDPDFLIKLATELKHEQEKRKALETKIQADKPKVLFADSVATSNTCILIGELAKILRGNGVNIGQNRLFAWLRSNGFLISRKGTDYNMPTQKAMDLDLFRIKETTITHSDGHISISRTPKVTGKGQQYFINKLINENMYIAQ